MKHGKLEESAILRPKDPKLSEDDWHEIPLSNVDVFGAGTHEPANLLLASEKAPVDVVGKLAQLPADLRQIVLDRTALPATIVIRNVEHFAYGQDDNMDVVLWADGGAGWFKIKNPSKAYKSIYQDMVEAVTVLYFLVDLLSNKKGRKYSAENVFKKYVEQPESRCQSLAKAAETFRKHKIFLLSKMQQGRDLGNCRNTPIFEHLQAITNDSSEEEDDDDEDDLIATPAQDSEAEAFHARRLASKGKSSLRPRSNLFSNKSAGRRQNSGQNDEDEDMPDTPQREQSPSTRKRKHRGAGQSRPRKRAATSEPTDSTTGDVSMNDEENGDEEHPLPLRSGARRKPLPKSSKEPIMKIIEDPLPSYEPQDPDGDVWTCTFDGCTHRIYNASESDSKALIKEHYRNHAFESQKQIDLIYQEERPYLPVGNLIKRIREMAAHHISKGPSNLANGANDVVFPKPIEQRY